jgi:hypothetical protein
MEFNYSEEQIQAALARTNEYFVRNAVVTLADLDEVKGTNSAGGMEAWEMANNSLQSVFSTGDYLEVVTDDKIKFLAEERLYFMQYPEFDAMIPNNSHLNSFRRLAFDKFLYELGGWELSMAVIKKAAELAPYDLEFGK